MIPHRFHPAALAEYLAAALWYGHEGGRRFADAVDRCVDEICEVPLAGSPWRGRAEIRRRVLRRFPYSVVYAVDAEGVLIVAVAHHRRRPGYWAARLRGR